MRDANVLILDDKYSCREAGSLFGQFTQPLSLDRAPSEDMLESTHCMVRRGGSPQISLGCPTVRSHQAMLRNFSVSQ